jgi:hypothetical protein
MIESHSRLRFGRSSGRGLWLVAGSALLALCVWVPLALANAGRSSASVPVNVQAPAVVGTVQEGQVVRADPGRWQGTGPITLSFSWQLCDVSGSPCTNEQGLVATDRIYAVRSGDVGKTLRVVVTASNRLGSTLATSEPSAEVTPAPAASPRDKGLPVIAGTPREGETLVAQPGAWTRPNGQPIRFGIAYSYQWRICDASGGACKTASVTGQSYTVQAGDVGHSVRVLVRARVAGLTPAAQRTAWALSDPTAVVGPLQTPVNTAAPTITGKAQADELLTAHPGTWRGAQPVRFQYQWLRCDQNGQNCVVLKGATQGRYKLGERDIGHRLRVLVTAVGRVGRTAALSGSTDVVKALPVPGPANTQTPTIAGTAVQGATLTLNVGSWQGQGPITYTYEWLRCDAALKTCATIGGASKNTYTLTGADVGHRLFARVTARNAGGISVASSSPTAVVQGSPPPPPPSATSATVSINQVSLPDRLLVDRLQFTPTRVTSTAQPLTVRIHVSEIQSGRSVSGAIVYAVGVPYNRLSNQPEVITGPDGWATITYRVLPTFQLKKGGLIVLFVRARKPGENLLAGVSTRRLVSVTIG